MKKRPSFQGRLIREFRNREYRQGYLASFKDSYIATQMKVLREQRHLTQAQLAKKAGMSQSRIAMMEDVNYSSWSVRTLQRLADAFDLALVVRFESYGAMLPEIRRFGRRALERPSYQDDRRLRKGRGAPPAGEGTT